MLAGMEPGQAALPRLRAAGRCLLPLAAVAIALIACSSGATPDPVADGRQVLRLLNGDGEAVILRVEIANTAASREVGLSGRDSLGADEGMLFVIEQRGPGFWMKDTRIPLTVAFIDACGAILAFADMEPFSLSLHNTEQPYSFGLEVNQGWFARNSIGVGDRLEIPPALRQPGCA